MQMLMEILPIAINVVFIFLCMQSIKKQKIKLNLRNINVIWLSILMLFSTQYIPVEIACFRPIIALLIFSFLYSCIYKHAFIKGINISFVMLFILFVAEIIYSIFLLILNIDFYIMLETTYGQIFSNFIIGLICFVFVFINKFKKIIISILKNLNKNNFLVPTITLIILMGILTSKNAYLGINFEYFINMLLIFIYIILIVMFFYERKNKQNLFEQQEMLYENIVKYEKELLEKNKIIHNFKNQIFSISGLICSRNKKAKEYLIEITNDIKKIKESNIKGLEKIPMGGLKGLFYYKLIDIEKYGINLNLNVNKNIYVIEKMDISTYKNIVKIIGVYLDNAIEAAKTSKQKLIEIEIFKQKKKIIFIISNSYNKKEKVKLLDNNRCSSKGKNRGYGLLFIKNILKEHNEFTQTLNITPNIYSVTFQFELKNLK